MKKLLFLVLIPCLALAAGKLQNSDFKTEADILSAGGTKAQLLNDTKIYVTAGGINKTLDDAIIDGDIAPSLPLDTNGDLLYYNSGLAKLAAGATGKILTMSALGFPEWADAPISLPNQVGQAGKYLKTNGSVASWNEVNNDINDIKNNLLNCASFENCTPEGVITVGSGFDLSGTTTRTVEASAYNASKLNVVGSATDTLSYKVTKSINFQDQQMYAYCEIKTSKPLTVFRVYADSNLQSSLDVSSDNKWKYYKIPFVGGATSQEFEVYSNDTTSASGIDIDNCYIGKANPDLIQEISEAHLVGIADETTAASCTHAVTVVSAGTYYSTPTDANCASYVNSGDIKGYDDLTKIQIPNARTDGYYKIELSGVMYPNTSGNNCIYALFNNETSERFATTSIERFATSPASYSQASQLIGSTRFATIGSHDIEMKVSSNINSTNCLLLNNSVGLRKLRWEVHFYPDDKATIVQQSSELTAKTANEFSGLANCSATSSIIDSSYNHATSITNESSGDCTITYSSELQNSISNSLRVTPTVVSSVGNVSYTLVSSTTTGFTVSCDVGGTPCTSYSFIWKAQKHNNDLNKSQIIYGKFENVNSNSLGAVYAAGNNGGAVNSSTDINFTEITDKKSNWNGTTYTATRNVRLDFSGSVDITTTTNIALYVYVNGVQKHIVGFQGANIQEHGFSGSVDLLAGQAMSIRTTSAVTLLNDARFHWITIDEKPDYESVIANLSKQKTKCQTKILSANSNTSGILAELTFPTIAGKMYQIINQHIGDDNAILSIQENGNIIGRHYVDGGTGFVLSFTTMNTIFKATGTTLTHVKGNTAGTYGNGTRQSTYSILCELPDSYIETTL